MPPKWQEKKQCLLWADMHASGIDRWGTTNAVGVAQASQASLYGRQVNALMVLKAMPNLAIGVVGGWEAFNYTEQNKGATVGPQAPIWAGRSFRHCVTTQPSPTPAIAYNGIAGTTRGNFTGEGWMLATGLTGTYKTAGFLIEPSANVYPLWEHENAYVDSLGNQQGSHDFLSAPRVA